MFVRVVQTGSSSAAARDFKIGQPAVSRMIAGLEDRLSARLLVRSTRRLRPTKAGRAFYERALRTLTRADEAECSVPGSRGSSAADRHIRARKREESTNHFLSWDWNPCHQRGRLCQLW
jgi:DNA-binding transcriptional LysR family regulator